MYGYRNTVQRIDTTTTPEGYSRGEYWWWITVTHQRDRITDTEKIPSGQVPAQEATGMSNASLAQLGSVIEVPLIISWVFVLDQAPRAVHLDYMKVVRSRAPTDKYYLLVYAQNFSLVWRRFCVSRGPCRHPVIPHVPTGVVIYILLLRLATSEAAQFEAQTMHQADVTYACDLPKRACSQSVHRTHIPSPNKSSAFDNVWS